MRTGRPIRHLKAGFPTPPQYYPSVGFNYAQAVNDLLAVYGREALAEAIGYNSKTQIRRIQENGAIPMHSYGEALYALYYDTFKKKPPLTEEQKKGIT